MLTAIIFAWKRIKAPENAWQDGQSTGVFADVSYGFIHSKTVQLWTIIIEQRHSINKELLKQN